MLLVWGFGVRGEHELFVLFQRMAKSCSQSAIEGTSINTTDLQKEREAYLRHVQIVGGRTDVVAPLIASLICNGVQPHKPRKRVGT